MKDGRPTVHFSLTYQKALIGEFHQILKHRESPVGRLYAYGHFMLWASEQISLNCIYFQTNLNRRSTAVMNN